VAGQCDVLVIGAGYAGLAAAIEASEAGASVIVLGRRNPFASNSSIGGGVFALVDTPLQREKGVRDSAELLVEDILKANRHSIPQDLVAVAVQESTELYGWMTELGVRFPELLQFPGHSVARVHLESGMSGANTMRLLLEAVGSRGVDVRLGTTAENLILGNGKAVVGVQAVREGTKTEIRANRAVVLAAGGFGRNPNMMARYLPELKGVTTISAAGSTGDGIRMGIEVGAELHNMDSAVLASIGSVKKGSRIPGIAQILLNGAILVNKNGQRFADESEGYIPTALPILHQPDGIAFLIFNEELLKGVEQVSDQIDKYVGMGLIQYGKTADELATAAGIDQENLQETVKKHLLVGSLYGIWVKPILLMTHGGLKINAQTQVMHSQGYPIPHLYAVGDSTAGLGGAATAECPCPGYLTGCGYLWALGSGRVAGRNAAENRN